MNLGLGLGFLSQQSAGVLAPTLTALSSPLLATAAGGGRSITLQGTNLSGVSAVHVGAASATSVSSTSTSVTFTAPANTASATPYNVSATTSGGTATLSSVLYSLPANILNCWYAAQYNASAGTWTDLVGGVVATAAIAGMTKPSLTASWTNGQPGVTGAGSNALQTSAVLSQGQPNSVFLIANETSDANTSIYFDGGASGVRFAGYTSATADTLNFYVNGLVIAATSTLTSTPELVEFYCQGTGAGASSINVNNGTAQTGTLTTQPFTDFTIGSRYDGNATITSGMVGSIGIVAIYNGTPTSGDRTIVHGICSAIYGTP